MRVSALARNVKGCRSYHLLSMHWYTNYNPLQKARKGDFLEPDGCTNVASRATKPNSSDSRLERRGTSWAQRFPSVAPANRAHRLPVTPYSVQQLHKGKWQVQTQEEKQIPRCLVGKDWAKETGETSSNVNGRSSGQLAIRILPFHLKCCSSYILVTQTPQCYCGTI